MIQINDPVIKKNKILFITQFKHLFDKVESIISIFKQNRRDIIVILVLEKKQT